MTNQSSGERSTENHNPRHPSISYLAGLLCALAALLSISCDGTTRRSVGSTVLAIDGVAEIRSNTNVAPLAIGARLPVGTTLETAAESSASLSILPGALLEVLPKTKLVLDMSQLAKDGTRTEESMRRRIALSLIEGATLLVTQFEADPNDFRVRLPGATVQITTPTVCSFEVSGVEWRCICVRGAVRVEPTDRSTPVNLETGFAYASPRATALFSADSDAQTQEAIDNSLNLERKLLGLQDRARTSPFYRRKLSRSQNPAGTSAELRPAPATDGLPLCLHAEGHTFVSLFHCVGLFSHRQSHVRRPG